MSARIHKNDTQTAIIYYFEAGYVSKKSGDQEYLNQCHRRSR